MGDLVVKLRESAEYYRKRITAFEKGTTAYSEGEFIIQLFTLAADSIEMLEGTIDVYAKHHQLLEEQAVIFQDLAQ